MKKETKILLGIAGAALAGAVAGLLLAPDKGSETRRKIKDTAGDWAGKIKRMAGKAKYEAMDLADEAAEHAEDLAADVRHKAGKVKASLS
jgi:gas vesicle protein